MRLNAECLPLEGENLMSFAVLAELTPIHGRGGGPVNATTIWRWATVGVIGRDGNRRYLEAVKIGRCWRSSLEAMERFCETPIATAERARSLAALLARIAADPAAGDWQLAAAELLAGGETTTPLRRGPQRRRGTESRRTIPQSGAGVQNSPAKPKPKTKMRKSPRKSR